MIFKPAFRYMFISKPSDNSANNFNFSNRVGLIVITILIFSSVISFSQEKSLSLKKWVESWSTAPQLVEPGNKPPLPGLSNNTLRQIVRVSIGGDTLRIRLSNEFSNDPIKINSIHIATSKGNGMIDITTDTAILFNGFEETTIDRGKLLCPIHFNFHYFH